MLDDATWKRLALIWVNHPGNPTGATAPPAFYAELAERCRREGVVLASDEAYSEIWLDGEPPASVLQVDDPTHRPRVPLAVQALLDAGVPLGVRRRRSPADRGAQAGASVARGDAADLRAARGDRRLG